MKKYTGKQLQFISQIKRDGSGVVDVRGVDLGYTKTLMDAETFELYPLSKTKGTYIAFGFNAYVVKLKPNEKN